MSDRIIAGKPVSRESEPFVDGLFDPELASRLVSGGHHVRCEIECAKSEAGLSFQSFREFRIEVISRVITSVLNGDENVISQQERPAIFPAVVSLPLNRWCWSGRRWPWRCYA